MLFGGLQKNSLIDYPGKIATVFFTVGCNFNCPYCHNPELVKPPADLSDRFHQDFAYEFLRERRDFIEGVVISGGEPTLQHDLGNVCREIQKLGFSIKLDTNGSQPQVIARLIEDGLLDYIAMDIKTAPDRYVPVFTRSHQPENILKSIQLIMASGVAYEFKTTCIRPVIDASVIKIISRLIRGAACYALQKFRKTTVLHPAFFENHPDQFDEDDLSEFQTIAAEQVEKCLVR